MPMATKARNAISAINAPTMRFSLVWLVAHEYLAYVDEKLTAISRALSVI